MEAYEVMAVLDAETPNEELEQETQEIISVDLGVIASQQDYDDAAQFGRRIKDQIKKVQEWFAPMKDNAYRAHREICDREKEALKPLQATEKQVKGAMSQYLQKVEMERRRAAEAERKRMQEEAEKRMREALALEEAGKKEAAEDKLNEATVVESLSFVPPVAAPVKAEGVSVRTDWEIAIVDDAAVPIAINGAVLRPVDTAAIMRMVRATKGKIEIPGVEIKEVQKIAMRA